MSKWRILLLCALLLAAAPGCGEKKEAENTNSGKESVDIDLTVMSSTMVYAEVFNMMVTPEDYVGKTIKMKGTFREFVYEKTGNPYYTCFIQDATACCAQGVEFILTEDYVYPDDYPEVDSEITVVGTFDTYIENEIPYCTLRNARLL